MRIMNKCQKIVGVIVFGVIGITLIYLIMAIGADYMYQDLITSENRSLWNAFTHIVTLECVAVMCYLMSLALFICLWRKGGKR